MSYDVSLHIKMVNTAYLGSHRGGASQKSYDRALADSCIHTSYDGPRSRDYASSAMWRMKGCFGSSEP